MKLGVCFSFSFLFFFFSLSLLLLLELSYYGEKNSEKDYVINIFFEVNKRFFFRLAYTTLEKKEKKNTHVSHNYTSIYTYSNHGKKYTPIPRCSFCSPDVKHGKCYTVETRRRVTWWLLVNENVARTFSIYLLGLWVFFSMVKLVINWVYNWRRL